MNKAWTPEHDREVLRLMADHTAGEVSRMTGRTVTAIYQRMTRLGFRKVSVPTRDWTPEECDRLIELYPTTSNLVLVELFGRSQSALHQRARLLGVRKIPPAGLAAEDPEADEPDACYTQIELAPGHRVIRFGRQAPHNHALLNRTLPQRTSSLGGF